MTLNFNGFDSGVGRPDVDLKSDTNSRALSQFAQELMQSDRRRNPPVDCDKNPLSKGCESPGGSGLENLRPGKNNEKECDEARTGKEAKDAKDGKEAREGQDPRRLNVRRHQSLPQLEIVGN